MKRSTRDGPARPTTNPVAKFASKVNNRCVAFRDRTRYSRKAKHKGRELLPMGLTVESIGKGFRSRAIG